VLVALPCIHIGAKLEQKKLHAVRFPTGSSLRQRSAAGRVRCVAVRSSVDESTAEDGQDGRVSGLSGADYRGPALLVNRLAARAGGQQPLNGFRIVAAGADEGEELHVHPNGARVGFRASELQKARGNATAFCGRSGIGGIG
jgi:hypothetical protein